MTHLLAKHNTHTGLYDLTFQHTLIVLVVEELDIPGTAVVQAVFYGYIINKGFILLYRTSGRHFTAYHYTEAVIPETFGELEIIIRAFPAAIGIIHRFHAHIDIKCFSGNIRDFALQE